MRGLLQRVSSASVVIEGKEYAAIEQGLVILLGIKEGDDKKAADYLADKIVNLRIFEDNNGKVNLSAMDVGADLLVISQFTLYADCRKGRRPSFIKAAKPGISEPLYNYVVEKLKESGLRLTTGKFGADMLVKISNNGPVTIMLDSEEKR
ncbi:D-tyrosyl-tRNA(Tyr) deacylase [candidate division KSB1 bacterium]|nr:D-tyrosyl-tRNA(Tyr) deacylase [candidate division KSB1 bacterium]